MISRFATILLIFVSASQAPLLGQEFTLNVVASNGGADANTLMTLEWTLGEIATASYTDNNRGFTEGFHQPIPASLTDGPENLNTAVPFEAPNTEVVFSFYPNPVQTKMTIEVSSTRSSALHLQVYELNGAMLNRQVISSTENNAEIDFSTMPSGFYIVRIVNEAGRTVATQKVSRI